MASGPVEFSEIRSKANRAVAIASASIAGIVVAGTLFRLRMEGFQPIFPLIWSACVFAVLPAILLNRMTDAAKSISLWLAWTFMAFAAFFMFGIGSAGLIFIIVATSFASLNLSFRKVMVLLALKAAGMAGLIAFFSIRGQFPVPPMGIQFFEQPNIWIVHSVIIFGSAAVIVYITTIWAQFNRDVAASAEGSFFYGVGLLSLAQDIETGHHLSRVSKYSGLLAQYYLQRHPLEAVKLDVRDMELATNLHDIGKILTPSSILKKPAKLSPEEFEEIKLHTIEGAKLIQQLEDKSDGISKSRLRIAKNIAIGHHENWDGSGYPEGKAGHEIPVEARIVSVCDVYDALRSLRPYKPALSHEESIRLMKDMTHKFDPEIFGIFLERADAFDGIFKGNR
jgi:HD-GYP domain-containing protein (c-di-GMP phosphodiesterase class II)